MMFLSKKEAKIIRTFYGNLDKYENENMQLIWKDGSQIYARFDTCFEDDNQLEMEDLAYEEYCSFIFEVLAIKGNPPIDVSCDKLCIVNYKNFPEKIMVGTRVIN